jgi:thioredoxin-dependent peroxiredoxin
LREDFTRFTEAGASVVAIAPEDVAAVERYAGQHPVPYAILADPDHTVFDAYDVASRALSLGQRPALFVIDRAGVVRFETVGTQQWQIPTNEQVLAALGAIS